MLGIKPRDFATKQDLRCFVKNELINKKPSPYGSRPLISYLKSLIRQKNFKYILLFYPMAYEANVLPLLKILKKQKNKKIFIPSICGFKFKMLPFRLPLRQNQYKIWEPRFSHYYFEKIDLAIIPCLGVDSHFKRIGMGKGMYDRKFSEIKRLPYMIFVSQNLYIAQNRLTQDFDICADEYISYRFRIKRGLRNDMDVVDNKPCRFRAHHRVSRLSSL